MSSLISAQTAYLGIINISVNFLKLLLWIECFRFSSGKIRIYLSHLYKIAKLTNKMWQKMSYQFIKYLSKKIHFWRKNYICISRQYNRSLLISSKTTYYYPTSHWGRSGVFIINFEHNLHLFSSVSIAEFEQVKVLFYYYKDIRKTTETKKCLGFNNALTSVIP